jgi:hypothetical protein
MSNNPSGPEQGRREPLARAQSERVAALARRHPAYHITLTAEPVLFSAERAASSAWYPAAFLSVFLLPLLYAAPEFFVLGIGIALVLAGLNQVAFRFQLTASELRIKGSFLLPPVRLPLEQIASAESRLLFGQGSGPGILILTTVDGRQLVIAGVARATEAAHAVMLLRRPDQRGAA